MTWHANGAQPSPTADLPVREKLPEIVGRADLDFIVLNPGNPCRPEIRDYRFGRDEAWKRLDQAISKPPFKRVVKSLNFRRMAGRIQFGVTTEPTSDFWT